MEERDLRTLSRRLYRIQIFEGNNPSLHPGSKSHECIQAVSSTEEERKLRERERESKLFQLTTGLY